MKRQRGRGRRSGGGGNNLNKHFESNGPDVKIRGSAQQILDKYLQYARDAQTSGDRVMSEAYFQHAEHYQRLIESMQPRDTARRDRQGVRGEDDGSDDSDDAQGENAAPGPDDSSESDTAKPRRSRTPRRKEDSDASDGLKVIDGKDESSDTKSQSAPAEESGEAPAKPKRRRTYKRKEAPGDDQPAREEGAGGGDEGVMSTLARGQKEDGQPPADSQSDAGEDEQSSGDSAKAAAR